MNRRALATAAATAGLVLAPTAALADTDDGGYAGEEAYLEISNEQGGEAFTFTATVFGADEYEDGEEVTLTVTSEDESVPDSAIEIAGTASQSGVLEGGSAAFDVAISEEGTYEIVATDSDGEFIASAVVEVYSEGEGDDDGGLGGGLPETGAPNSTPLVVGAALLLAAGAGAMVFARTRQTQA
ncbi:LAETG motif-containing sortase-dependent surface protein [Georgenia alba]|uniref:LAETG motif-containing sortase-dependent surface protein n=1 Tax=Georgenia alba TaxID=2233858 RepID=A0ABW2Q663_9MICO